MKVEKIGSLFLLLLITYCNGDPRFANYYQDHMVLQRAPQKAVVWGFGDPSTLTILTMNDKTYTTVSRSELANAQNESIWSVTLDPVSDEGPFDIHVSQPLKNGTLITITIHDVLFGDVWICSGQSNMQMTVSVIFNATIEIQNAGQFPKIRLFTASLIESSTPLEELPGILQNWSVASPQSVGGPDWQYMSAVCWLYGRMIHTALGGRPMGLIATSWGGTVIEFWMPPQALHDCNVTTHSTVAVQSYDDRSTISDLPMNHSGLYNAMIYPFTRMVIYGAIWYQGEANTGYNVDQYVCTFPKMIAYWRQTWYNRTNGLTDSQFPFGFVQLCTWRADTTIVGNFPIVRWHQTFDMGYVPNSVIPQVFMAISLDLRDDPNGVHSRYKHDVGYRLSRSGLAVAYGQQIEFQGPVIQSITHSNDSKIVNVTYTGVSGLDIRSPIGFEVCCQGTLCWNDALWVPSPISSKDGLTITLTVDNSCTDKQLIGFRYLWRETPCLFKQAALYSATDANLPAPPYFKYF